MRPRTAAATCRSLGQCRPPNTRRNEEGSLEGFLVLCRPGQPTPTARNTEATGPPLMTPARPARAEYPVVCLVGLEQVLFPQLPLLEDPRPGGGARLLLTWVITPRQGAAVSSPRSRKAAWRHARKARPVPSRCFLLGTAAELIQGDIPPERWRVPIRRSKRLIASLGSIARTCQRLGRRWQPRSPGHAVRRRAPAPDWAIGRSNCEPRQASATHDTHPVRSGEKISNRGEVEGHGPTSSNPRLAPN